MLLYIKGKEHGKQRYDSVINGPFQYGTVKVPITPSTLASIRDRTYEDLKESEKIREACDIRATNIVLQGLPPDIYSLVNHHTVAKEIWDSVKLLIEGKEHGKQRYDSVINGPFQYGTVKVPITPSTLASIRDRTYEDLKESEKIREACDIRATNIVLQGLPPDIYSLVNHHTVAKEIWDSVKLLIEGSELLL
nr:hypothetical protein [Tanacetum cinerariifolium]